VRIFRWIVPAAVGLLIACGPAVQQSVGGQAAPPARSPAALTPGTPVPGFGVGRPASPEEVAAIDIDVSPDGRGLPEGGASAAAGDPVYAAKCAGCHGPGGEGARGRAGPVVGRKPNDAFDFALTQESEGTKTVGNYWPYATTLFDYIRRSMPFDRPGSLTNDEVYGVTAWILWKNQIIPREMVMDSASLPKVMMPARNRFERDDRETSPRVK
jgi:S-disulfanyl-L-cysteine oxidoreductase SoxD